MSEEQFAMLISMLRYKTSEGIVRKVLLKYMPENYDLSFHEKSVDLIRGATTFQIFSKWVEFRPKKASGQVFKFYYQ
ncbi:MAG: hypothetical protein ACRC1D_07020 [Culicoidibacterales bacterium]